MYTVVIVFLAVYIPLENSTTLQQTSTIYPALLVYSCNNACCLYTLQDVLTGFHTIVVQCV